MCEVAIAVTLSKIFVLHTEEETHEGQEIFGPADASCHHHCL